MVAQTPFTGKAIPTFRPLTLSNLAEVLFINPLPVAVEAMQRYVILTLAVYSPAVSVASIRLSVRITVLANVS